MKKLLAYFLQGKGEGIGVEWGLKHTSFDIQLHMYFSNEKEKNLQSGGGIKHIHERNILHCILYLSICM